MKRGKKMIEKVSFEMNNLVYIEKKATTDQLVDLILHSEELVYEEGFYKNGPTMIELKPTELREEKQIYKFYIPVNEPVEGGDIFTIESIHYDYLARKRMPFDEELGANIEEITDYLQEQKIEFENKLLLVMTLVYDEYWVDVLIPIKEQVNK
ncbi:hypothetical protein QRK71_000538 [Enterococcus faecium]|nr:hypothetical protein [Enterococcus faecium]EME3563172.1 hypothetical protein [Enterococcus faecium]EME7135286.1 hypothetical protein [Enterococcus faecium]